MGQQHQPARGSSDDRAAPGRGRGDDRHRAVAVIRAELADVERHLRDVPPHHGGGAADLGARADALRRELAAATAATRAEQAAQAQQQ